MRAVLEVDKSENGSAAFIIEPGDEPQWFVNTEVRFLDEHLARSFYAGVILLKKEGMIGETVTQALRGLVKRTCHTPIMAGGCFVPIHHHERGEGMRREVATAEEMLLALEMEIRTLQTANTYLRSLLPKVTP